jgi:sortase A
VVVSGTAPSDLLAGPGHKRDTPLPGQQGISVVMGRGSTYGAPFRHLGDLVPGDTIAVQNAQGEVTYTVDDVRRAGDPIPAAPTGSQGRLIMASSEGSGPLSALSPHTAVYVDATTPKAFPDGPLPGSQVPATELPMARDTTNLTTLVLLLGGLVLLVWAISAATRHFRAALVWVFATPCVIAVAWAVTDQVMRLLPNLM